MLDKQVAIHLKDKDGTEVVAEEERQSPPFKELMAECAAASEGKIAQTAGSNSNSGKDERTKQEEINHEYNKGSASDQPVPETN